MFVFWGKVIVVQLDSPSVPQLWCWWFMDVIHWFKYPYHSWDWQFYLHENHKDQPNVGKWMVWGMQIFLVESIYRSASTGNICTSAPYQPIYRVWEILRDQFSGIDCGSRYFFGILYRFPTILRSEMKSSSLILRSKKSTDEPADAIKPLRTEKTCQWSRWKLYTHGHLQKKELTFHYSIHVVFKSIISKISRKRYVSLFSTFLKKKPSTKRPNGFRNFPGLDRNGGCALPQVLKIVKSVHLPPLVEASSLLTIGEAWSVATQHQWMVCRFFGIIISSVQPVTGWWFQTFFMFILILGKGSNLTNIFRMGWHHVQWPSRFNGKWTFWSCLHSSSKTPFSTESWLFGWWFERFLVPLELRKMIQFDKTYMSNGWLNSTTD